MIAHKLSPTQTLIVESNYDSGTHKGFTVGVSEEGEYTCTTLDKVLSKGQIEGLEAIILHYVTMYIEDNQGV